MERGRDGWRERWREAEGWKKEGKDRWKRERRKRRKIKSGSLKIEEEILTMSGRQTKLSMNKRKNAELDLFEVESKKRNKIQNFHAID
jgi:hypothetical protein